MLKHWNKQWWSFCDFIVKNKKEGKIFENKAIMEEMGDFPQGKIFIERIDFIPTLHRKVM